MGWGGTQILPLFGGRGGAEYVRKSCRCPFFVNDLLPRKIKYSSNKFIARTYIIFYKLVYGYLDFANPLGGHPCSTNPSTLREVSSQTNVILQYKLLASILSAVCSVIQQS